MAIKAVYQHHGWLFPYVHDLERLLDGLVAQGLTIRNDVREADKLSTYAVETRYPGLAPPVTDVEYQHALRTAEVVLKWAESLIPELIPQRLSEPSAEFVASMVLALWVLRCYLGHRRTYRTLGGDWSSKTSSYGVDGPCSTATA